MTAILLRPPSVDHPITIRYPVDYPGIYYPPIIYRNSLWWPKFMPNHLESIKR